MQNLIDVESSLLDVEQVFGTMVSDFRSQDVDQPKACPEAGVDDHAVDTTLAPGHSQRSDLHCAKSSFLCRIHCPNKFITSVVSISI